MAEEKRKGKENVVVELKVSMYCNACERTIFKTLSKFKGVETVVTDMATHRAVVTGKVEAEKLMKRLKRKTGKKVEILPAKKGDKDGGGNSAGHNAPDGTGGIYGEDVVKCEDGGLFGGMVRVDVFSDENPNACMIM